MNKKIELFEKKFGVSLLPLNGSSSTYAFSVEKAYAFVGMLNSEGLIVLGGDIITGDKYSLKYANEDWGIEYHCLDWYFQKDVNDTFKEHLSKSMSKAKKAINTALEVSKRLKKNILINIVY